MIPLRGVAGATHPVKMIYPDPAATAFEDTPMLAGCPYFREVLGGVRLRGSGGAADAPDARLGDQGTHRPRPRRRRRHGAVHIPITTSPEVEFELNRRRIVMAPGEAWYLRLSDPHRVANKGASDRVHLVADLVVNAWLTDLLGRSEAGLKRLSFDEREQVGVDHVGMARRHAVRKALVDLQRRRS